MGIALVLGFLTRPLALLLVLCALAAGFIGHHYWTLVESAHMERIIDFYKSISVSGLLLLGLAWLDKSGQGNHDAGVAHRKRGGRERHRHEQ